MAKSDEEKLADIEKQMAKLAAARNAITAKQKERDRKLETRRKIVLGSMLLEHAEHNVEAWDMVHTLLNLMKRDQDKKLFADFPIEPPAMQGVSAAAAVGR